MLHCVGTFAFRRRWRMQRAIRMPSAEGMRSATERSEALGAKLWQRSKFGERSEQQILGTATGVTFLSCQESTQRRRRRGGADECAYRFSCCFISYFSAHSRPPLRTPPGTLRVVVSCYRSFCDNSNSSINQTFRTSNSSVNTACGDRL